MGALVLALRNGVRDPAGAQPRPVGPRAVGLVGHQVVGAHTRPADPTRPRHPDCIHQPEQLGSIRAWPGVMRVTSGRPRPSPSRCTLVDRPPRERPNPCCAADASGVSPLAGAGGVLVGAHHAGVGLHRPVQLAGGIGRSLHGLLDPGPGAIGLPAGKPLVAGLLWPVLVRQVPPRRPSPGPPDDPVDHLPVIPPAATPPARLGWQQRAQPLPLRIREVSSSHGTPLPHQHAIRETRPRAGVNQPLELPEGSRDDLCLLEPPPEGGAMSDQHPTQPNAPGWSQRGQLEPMSPGQQPPVTQPSGQVDRPHGPSRR
jgi:hypothetical protein